MMSISDKASLLTGLLPTSTASKRSSGPLIGGRKAAMTSNEEVPRYGRIWWRLSNTAGIWDYKNTIYDFRTFPVFF